MPSSVYRELFEAVWAPALLAAVGGCIRSMRFGGQSWRQFLVSIVISAFTGVVVHLLIFELPIPPSMQAAIVATSGYSGGVILDALVTRIIRSVQHLPGPGRGEQAVPAPQRQTRVTEGRD